MVRRPTEIFLKEDEQSPKDVVEGKDDLSQEELLRLPVHIPHRPKKDPRELRILDPACGSGHFLLYCFDLLVTIYEEAYADPELGPTLKKDYPTLDALKRDVPRLILAHNLHGIDIDLRASQIAALALWLRCQRAYQEMGLKKDRPQITRSNFVCAEPMPGEEQMLKEFVGQLEPKVLGQVVEVVFDKMKLAGEAGSLLKIEEEIRDAVVAAKKQYVRETTQATDRKGQPLLFTQAAMDRLAGKPEQPSLFDLSDITDNQFFEQAESRVIDTLRSYAEKAQNGQRLQRRLFSEDAVRGFSFVDLCQKRYDVVLMNPPFGDCSLPSREYLYKSYPNSKRNLACVFVEEAVTRLSSTGKLGAIAARTPLFTISFSDWRHATLFHDGHIELLWDLGTDVLDAMIETVAYVVSRSQTAHGVLHSIRTDKASSAEAIYEAFRNSLASLYVTDRSLLEAIPGSPVAYWATPLLLESFQLFPQFEGNFGTARQGLGTGDDFRFTRAACEVPYQTIGVGKKYVRYALGGSFRPFYEDIRTVVNWESDGLEMKDFERQRVEAEGKPARGNGPMRDCEFYYQPGFFFPRRTHRFCPKIMPEGCIFSVGGQAVFPNKGKQLAILGLLSSKVGAEITALMLGNMEQDPQFEVGVIKRIPISPDVAFNDTVAKHVHRIVSLLRYKEQRIEISSFFVGIPLSKDGLNDSYTIQLKASNHDKSSATDLFHEMDKLCCESYGTNPFSIDDNGEPWHGLFTEEKESFVKNVVSYCVGIAFGRWDIRFATNSERWPTLAGEFEALPSCPPALLQSYEPNRYPIKVGITALFVDDSENEHDLIHRMHDCFEAIWPDTHENSLAEACKVLNVTTLREYFRKATKGGFWEDHLSMYTIGRRKAPIYWLLQSSKKNYALWLYYHQLDKDLLFKALVNYVEPKIRLEASRLESLRTQKAAAGESGKEAKRLAKDVERQEDFISELRDFEDKLRRAANLHLEPDLNDGVVLNIAPLHELVPWKEAKKYWDELMEGKYEWSSIGKQLRQKGLVK
jgi:hypothetical protein